MKSFHDILLTEIMNTKVNVKVTDDSVEDGEYTTRFAVGEKIFFFNAAISDFDLWEVSFTRMIDNSKLVFSVLNDLDLKETLAVFSGVKKSMEMWIKAMDKAGEPLEFVFTSKQEESSRAKLYDKFAKTISKKLKIPFTRETGMVNGEKSVIYTFK